MATGATFTPRGQRRGRWKPRGVGPGAQTVALTIPRPAPSRPPSGYYDPSIDAQVSAGARGLGDLRIDTGTAHRRGLEDLNSTLAQLMAGERRTRADYGTSLGNLYRNYQALGNQQAEGAAQHGIQSQGLLAKQAQVRGENRGRELHGLNTSLSRALEDISLHRTNAQTAYGRQFGAGGDIDLGLARAEREQPFLEADANQQRLYQANQAGYVPEGGTVRLGPKRPRRRKFKPGTGGG